MIKINRLYHSGFLVETEHYFLIFDYFQGQLPDLSGKKIIVFVSHGHYDHYRPNIFLLEQQYDNVFFVLYDGISNRKQDNILYVTEHNEYELEGVKITTLKSTDEGCAFVVYADEKCYYHAGDLNWWHWEGEPDTFNEWQKTTYQEETDRLLEQEIDYSFIVLDPRQEKNALLGLLELVGKCKVNHIIPMHFDHWGGIEKIKPYLELDVMKEYLPRIYVEEELEFDD